MACVVSLLMQSPRERERVMSFPIPRISIANVCGFRFSVAFFFVCTTTILMMRRANTSSFLLFSLGSSFSLYPFGLLPNKSFPTLLGVMMLHQYIRSVRTCRIDILQRTWFILESVWARVCVSEWVDMKKKPYVI